MKYPIVVGTDLTEASNDALIQAEARASRDGMPLTVAHATSARMWGAANDGDATDRIRQLIQLQVTALTGRAKADYDVVVERGLAHSVLARLAVSRQALLVVGSHMHHGLGHALLRDVPERVVEVARGPVLVTRPRSGSGRILVAVDRSFATSRALDVAIEEARSAASNLTVLHCIGIGFIATLAADIINGGVYAERPLGQRSPIAEVRQALRVELRRRGVDADLYVVEGDAQQLVSQVATREAAELVIVGTTHRPGPVPHVTTAVLRHAPCSVMVVDEVSARPMAHAPSQAGAG